MRVSLPERVQAQKSPLNALPSFILAEIADELDVKDVISWGQTSHSFREKLGQPHILAPKLRGGRGRYGRHRDGNESEALWASASAEAHVMDRLRRQPMPLAKFDGRRPLAVSASGRFIVNQSTDYDILAVDLLRPKKQAFRLATSDAHVTWLRFFDEEGYLWGGSHETAHLWELPGSEEPRLVLRHLGENMNFRLGDEGRWLVAHDDASKTLQCFARAALLAGHTTPARTFDKVEHFAIAAGADTLVVVKSGLLSDRAIVFDLPDAAAVEVET